MGPSTIAKKDPDLFIAAWLKASTLLDPSLYALV